MHTCSHTPLALAAKQKQTFPGEEATTGQLLPDPVGGFAGHELRAVLGAPRLGLALPPWRLPVHVHKPKSCLLMTAKLLLLFLSSSSSSPPPQGGPAPQQELAQRPAPAPWPFALGHHPGMAKPGWCRAVPQSIR